MRSGKNLAVSLVATLLALAAGVYIGLESRGRPESSAPQALIESTAISRLFAARMNDAEGKPQLLSQWQGKILVINFWATWCTPCREEMPAFSRLQTKYSSNSVQFVGIALDTAENVVDFSKKYPVTYPLLNGDSEGAELARQLGNSRLALPYTVVLGGKNEVLLTRLGRVSEQELDALLQKSISR